MDRFQNVVRMNLYGHTHNEDIQVVQSITSNLNIGINYYAGSMTTNINKNPNFSVIEFDAEYMAPLNIKTYSYDVLEANANGAPNWQLLYDYLSYYNLPDMRPDNIFNMATSVRDQESQATLYAWNRNRRVGPQPTTCNETCRLQLFCYMTCTETLQYQMCQGALLTDFNTSPFTTMLYYMMEAWISRK